MIERFQECPNAEEIVHDWEHSWISSKVLSSAPMPFNLKVSRDGFLLRGTSCSSFLMAIAFALELNNASFTENFSLKVHVYSSLTEYHPLPLLRALKGLFAGDSLYLIFYA